MPDELSFTTAIIIGLLGSTHCIGMCGGIVGTLSVGLKTPGQPGESGLLEYLLAYNTGRILSYCVIGAIAGLIGSGIAEITPSTGVPVGKLVGAGFMIILGMYLTSWWHGLALLERMGSSLWKHIEPFGRRYLPVQNPLQAFALGLVWGWLPCGLVYATLAWSLGSGSWHQGALLMFGFGIGTLPVLLMMGKLSHLLKHPALRTVAGIMIIGFGLYSTFVALSMGTTGA